MSIHSAAENQFIYDIAIERYLLWIGLKRGNSAWSWSDGTSLDYENWSPGNGGGGDGTENCGEMYLYSNHQPGQWNDKRCASTSPFVCQRTGNNPTGWEWFVSDERYLLSKYNVSILISINSSIMGLWLWDHFSHYDMALKVEGTSKNLLHFGNLM